MVLPSVPQQLQFKGSLRPMFNQEAGGGKYICMRPQSTTDSPYTYCLAQWTSSLNQCREKTYVHTPHYCWVLKSIGFGLFKIIWLFVGLVKNWPNCSTAVKTLLTNWVWSKWVQVLTGSWLTQPFILLRTEKQAPSLLVCVRAVCSCIIKL